MTADDDDAMNEPAPLDYESTPPTSGTEEVTGSAAGGLALTCSLLQVPWYFLVIIGWLALYGEGAPPWRQSVISDLLVELLLSSPALAGFSIGIRTFHRASATGVQRLLGFAAAILALGWFCILIPRALR